MKRYLSDVLKKYLDEEIPIKPNTPIECLIQAAQACVGIQEDGGDNRGKMVEAFQSTIGGAHGESWCLSFQQALIAYVEDRYNVVSNIPLTEWVWELWRKTDKKYKCLVPWPNTLVCWQYGNSTKGHVGLVHKVKYRVIETYEGNTSPSGIVEREGDGVYNKVRAISGTSLMHVLGFIKIEFK